MAKPTAYDFSFNALLGGALDLKQFQGNPLLIVNTASKCGFTPQYQGLQAIWTAYRDAGLTVIGVPSNDFGGQEPDAEPAIGGFCERNYGVTFPMTGKTTVKGKAAHPLFRWLAAEGGMLSLPRWNFFKYVIARDGSLASWFASTTTPENPRLRAAIETALQPS